MEESGKFNAGIGQQGQVRQTQILNSLQSRPSSGNNSASVNSVNAYKSFRSNSMLVGLAQQDAGVINNDPVNRSANQHLGSAMAKIQNYSQLKNGEKLRGNSLLSSQSNLNHMSQAANFLTP